MEYKRGGVRKTSQIDGGMLTTKRLEMQEEEIMKMREDRDKMRYFINSGFFGSGL